MIRIKIHKILLLLPLLALVACKEYEYEQTLSGEGKTPLAVTALLDAKSNVAKTRAADKEFANGDNMLFYLRHVVWNGGFTTAVADNRESKVADQAPRIINLTCTGSEDWNKTITDILPFEVEDVEINEDNTKQAAGLRASYTNSSSSTTNGLYWDDFSDASSAKTDLHKDGHYLQSYYGYCYNGGTPTTALVEATGVIGWTVQTDQSGTTEPTNFKKSDLLWSAEQTPVSYVHRDANVDADRPGLIIPYTHAMSKVTINVIAGDGFAADYDFADTSIKLDKVRVSCSASAPNASLDCAASTKSVVTMQPGDLGTTAEGKSKRAFQAIIVPSVLTEGNIFATIFDMDGNKYDIPVTSTILESWDPQLTDTYEEVHEGTAQTKPRTRSDDQTVGKGKGHQMKSGVNYVLNVTVNKTEVNVSATILDWNEIMAEGVGEIFFEHDIKDDGTIDEALKVHGFDVYKSTSTTFGTKATSLRWNRTSEKWKYTPSIYWLGAQNEYFRALSNVKTDASGTPLNESLAMENGRDALWGTTPAHNGTYDDGTTYSYDEGDALAPRTGKVPLLFYHAMAKITINLKDIMANTPDADPNSLLDLAGATIQLTNLATGGTIELDKGVITPSDKVEKTFSEDRGAIPSRMGFFAAKENEVDTYYNDNVTVRDYFITPQKIGDESLLIVTLANGTTYKAQLNACQAQKGSNYENVKVWERNKHYIYDITLAKDQILFRAEIKEWDEVPVSGIITPEW